MEFEPTQTESTKELDNIFDLSLYPDMLLKHSRVIITPKAYCNECGSSNCFTYTSIQEVSSHSSTH